MWGMLLSFLGGPIVNGLINAYKAKLDASNTAGAQAVDVAKAALIANEQARAEATKVTIAEQGRWYTALPRVAVQAGCAIFFLKASVWDNVIMGGASSTPDLVGSTALVYTMVMAFWFGANGTTTVLRTIRALWR